MDATEAQEDVAFLRHIQSAYIAIEAAAARLTDERFAEHVFVNDAKTKLTAAFRLLGLDIKEWKP